MDTNETPTESKDSNEQQKQNEEQAQIDDKSSNVNKEVDDNNEDKNAADSSSSIANQSLASTTTTAAAAAANSNRIEIMLKPVGSAPILKKKKFILERTKNVKWLIEWLKKYMKLDTKEQLFVYVNQEFAPSLDTEIGTIFDCFGISNTIIFHYCTTPAWG